MLCSCFYCYCTHFLMSSNCCHSSMQLFFTTITSHIASWHPSVSFIIVLAIVLTWVMIMHLLVTEHMKQLKLCMLNHFAHVGVVKVTSAFFVVVLLRTLFVTKRFKKQSRKKNIAFSFQQIMSSMQKMQLEKMQCLNLKYLIFAPLWTNYKTD